MKVILLKDVAKIGRRHSVVEVPDGYALNQLIPKKLAEAATPVNLKKIQNNQTIKANQDNNNQSRFDVALEALSSDPLKVSAGKVNAEGHLFKAIRVEDVIAAAGSKGVTLDSSMISFESPIKSVGLHTITLKQGSKKVACSIEVIK